ncbi:MAG TPA: methyltransferase [Gemmatimonadaceae bacterium]|jgi:release factor glutamine methyltransferase|nr:methyltransferase [Gemmatimonadaceae bacterium]
MTGLGALAFGGEAKEARGDPIVAPLIISVHLTADQRQRILDQTGSSISAIPYESAAPAVRCYFGGIPLNVPRGVFVPAAATERLLDIAVQAASTLPRPTIVDVGTGCGAVALAAAKALPRAAVFATDTSELALNTARANRRRLMLRNVRFVRGSLLAPLPRRLTSKVAVVVANVPYVPPRLADAFKHAFPEGTSIGPGEDGLDLVRELASEARRFLIRGGLLVLQLAGFQWTTLAAELLAMGYAAPELQEQSGNAPVVGRVAWPS